MAIKILPDAFAADPERLARFEREAKTLAPLNYLHIATIYAVEKSAGHHALVMELVEGDDLSQRIVHGGAISFDEALPIARQIAEALSAAHEQGITPLSSSASGRSWPRVLRTRAMARLRLQPLLRDLYCL